MRPCPEAEPCLGVAWPAHPGHSWDAGRPAGGPDSLLVSVLLLGCSAQTLTRFGHPEGGVCGHPSLWLGPQTGTPSA